MLLVTGVTGHTGKYFLQELQQNNYNKKVRFIVRPTTNTAIIEKSGLDYEIVKGDLTNNQFINSVMNEVDEIVHIYNIHHSIDILKAAITHNVKKVVLVHTTGIYSNFKDASARYKEIEQEIKGILESQTHTPTVVILRPSMIYGDLCDHNMSKFIKMVDTLKFIPVIDNGRSLIQPVNARDLGKAYYTALMEVHHTSDYDLTGDRPITMKEALELISLNLNKKVHFVNVPLNLGVFGARFIKGASINKVDVIEKVQRMAENRSYSHEKAFKTFGYKPLTFEKGIAEEVRQYLEMKEKKK